MVCHEMSGSSIKSFLHYADQIEHKYFGKYMTSEKVPPDFRLSKISVPITVHYSTADKLSTKRDALATISKLKKSDVYVQGVSELNHADFVMNENAPSLVYSTILKLFRKY